MGVFTELLHRTIFHNKGPKIIMAGFINCWPSCLRRKGFNYHGSHPSSKQLCAVLPNCTCPKGIWERVEHRWDRVEGRGFIYAATGSSLCLLGDNLEVTQDSMCNLSPTPRIGSPGWNVMESHLGLLLELRRGWGCGGRCHLLLPKVRNFSNQQK